MVGINEKALELGNALARTDEYQALKRAMDAADEDRELVELRNRIHALEEKIEELQEEFGDEKYYQNPELLDRLQEELGKDKGELELLYKAYEIKINP